MVYFSIIIPNKNNPELLQRCLKSIPIREDIQIIIVDDNSDENKIDFEKYPGLNQKNVDILFTKEGKGAGYARNMGLTIAKGSWIIFSDSDDEFITQNFSDKLTEYLYSEAEVIYFDVNVIDYNSGAIMDRNNPYQTILDSDNDDVENRCRYEIRVPWGKMIKKSLINQRNVRFDETPVANDVMFSLLIGHNAKQVIIDRTPIYNWYCKREGSITSSITKVNMLTHFDCSLRRNSFLYNHNKDIYRSNLLLFFPGLLRCGIPFLQVVTMIFRNTRKKYFAVDILGAVRLGCKKFFK